MPAQAFLDAVLDHHTTLTYVQGGPCRVTPSWVVQRRSIAEHLIYLVTEGACDGTAAGSSFRLEPGSLAWVMPGVVHEFRIPPGQPPFTFIHFKIGILHDGTPLRTPLPLVRSAHAQDLQPIALELDRCAQGRTPFAPIRLRAALALLLSSALALAQEHGRGGPALTLRQRQLIAAHVAQDPAARPSPASIAALLRLSPDYCTRAFRATYGIPPRAWLVRERMGVAAQRLADSPLRISEIAQELGYHDLFLFSRQFKQVFGVSPRAYRRPI